MGHFSGRHEFQWLAKSVRRMHFAAMMFRQPAIEVFGRSNIVTST
jgi:hypothetical protein